MSNAYCNGYVLTPIVEACLRHGVFERLGAARFYDRDRLIEECGANIGVLPLALQAMEAAQLLERNARGGYRLARGSRSDIVDAGLTALYGMDPREPLHSHASACVLAEAIERVFPGGRNAGAPISRLAVGAVVVPLFCTLKE